MKLSKIQLTDSRAENRRLIVYIVLLLSSETALPYVKLFLRETLINQSSVYVGEFPKRREVHRVRQKRYAYQLSEKNEISPFTILYNNNFYNNNFNLKSRLHPDATISALKPWPRYRTNSADVFHSSLGENFFSKNRSLKVSFLITLIVPDTSKLIHGIRMAHN